MNLPNWELPGLYSTRIIYGNCFILCGGKSLYVDIGELIVLVILKKRVCCKY